MTNNDFKVITDIAEDLIDHGVQISEYISEVVVPYKGNIYLVTKELTVEDILVGNSVTMKVERIVNIDILGEEEDDGYSSTEID